MNFNDVLKTIDTKLIAKDICSVQPMSGPIDHLFQMNHKYNVVCDEIPLKENVWTFRSDMWLCTVNTWIKTRNYSCPWCGEYLTDVFWDTNNTDIRLYGTHQPCGKKFGIIG